MRALKTAAALLLALAGIAMATTYPPYFGGSPNIAAGTQAEFLSGTFCVAASSMSAGTCTVKLDGSVGSIVGLLYSGPQFTSIAASSTTAAANISTLFSNVNSTGSALTIETARATAAEAAESARAIARENAIAVSTGSTYAALNSTGSALTIETNTRQTFQTLTAANTTTLFAQINSTGSALTIETARAIAAEAGKLGATAAAGGDLTGNYPNPSAAATQSHITTLSAVGGVSIPGGVSGSSASWTNGVTASSGTFTATGAAQYSIATSSGINVGGGGVVNAAAFKGDGSQLTNLPAAGGGATLSGNNAFIGNETHAGTEKFASTNTVTNIVLNSTASYAAININSEWTLISSTHPAGSSSFWFYNLVSTAPAGCTSRPVYKIDFALVAGAASGEYLVQFGAAGNSDVDKTTNYHGSMAGNANAGSLIINGWADAGCLLTYQSSTLGVRQNFPYQGTFVFSPMVGNDNFVYGRSDTYGNYGNDLGNRGSVLMSGCTWPETTRIGPLSFAKFTTTNGVTMTGDVSLWMQCTQ